MALLVDNSTKQKRLLFDVNSIGIVLSAILIGLIFFIHWMLLLSFAITSQVFFMCFLLFHCS